MTRYIIVDFFPALNELLNFAAPQLYDFILPPSARPIEHPFFNAVLFPLCAFGVLVCLYGSVVIKHSIYRKAVAFYGCMNIMAAISHCQLYRYIPDGAVTKSWWIAGDVGFTCACSLCLCLAATSKGQTQSMQQMLQQLSVLVAPAALAVAVAGNCFSSRPIPFVNEVLYVHPTLLAAYLLFFKELMQPNLPKQQRRAIKAAAWSFLITPPLLSINPLLMRFATEQGVLVDITHLYFLGCNLAVMFLVRYLQLQQQGQQLEGFKAADKKVD